jgi:hypothetical protein
VLDNNRDTMTVHPPKRFKEKELLQLSPVVPKEIQDE